MIRVKTREGNGTRWRKVSRIRGKASVVGRKETDLGLKELTTGCRRRFRKATRDTRQSIHQALIESDKLEGGITRDTGYPGNGR